MECSEDKETTWRRPRQLDIPSPSVGHGGRGRPGFGGSPKAPSKKASPGYAGRRAPQRPSRLAKYPQSDTSFSMKSLSSPIKREKKAGLPAQGKDVSFRKDLKDKTGLGARIPSSLIPEHMSVVEKSMFPPQDEDRECWYDPKEQVWCSVVFPSLKPSGRQDVVLLDQWLNQSLAEKKLSEGLNQMDRSAVVKEQLNILMIGFREIVRQVAVSCTERGMLLDKIWKAMSGLLDFVVAEMQETIIACEGRMSDLNLRASRHESEILSLKEEHASEVKVLTQSVGHRWGKRVEILKQALVSKENTLQENEAIISLMRRWFPSFSSYADTLLQDMLPEEVASSHATLEAMVMLPEEALTQDLKRVVNSTLVDVQLVENDDSGPADGEEEDGAADLAPSFGVSQDASSFIVAASKKSMRQQNQTVFRNLMSVSKNYKGELWQAQAELDALKKENEAMKVRNEKLVSSLEDENESLRHLLVASAHIQPIMPDISPTWNYVEKQMGGKVGMDMVDGTNNNNSSSNSNNNNLLNLQNLESKIASVGRTQREMVRYIKMFAEFESGRRSVLFGAEGRATNAATPRSGTWWMLKLSFADFVKQQILMKNPNNFHRVNRIFYCLAASCVKWSTQQLDERSRMQMGAFCKLLQCSKNPYKRTQEVLMLFLCNEVHEHFVCATEDDVAQLPLSVVPLPKAQKALKKAFVARDSDFPWRHLPPQHVDLALEKLFKASSDEFDGLHLELFAFLNIALDALAACEVALKNGIVHLCNVASNGCNDHGGLSWGDFNIIVDIVEDCLDKGTRATLFHKFSETALKKKGKKWEAEVSASSGGSKQSEAE